jgi:hypothetical protein
VPVLHCALGKSFEEMKECKHGKNNLFTIISTTSWRREAFDRDIPVYLASKISCSP